MEQQQQRYPGSLVVQHIRESITERMQRRKARPRSAFMTRLGHLAVAWEGVALVGVVCIAFLKFSADTYSHERATEFERRRELVTQYQLQCHNSMTHIKQMQESLGFWGELHARSEERAARWQLQHQVDQLRHQLQDEHQQQQHQQQHQQHQHQQQQQGQARMSTEQQPCRGTTHHHPHTTGSAHHPHMTGSISGPSGQRAQQHKASEAQGQGAGGAEDAQALTAAAGGAEDCQTFTTAVAAGGDGSMKQVPAAVPTGWWARVRRAFRTTRQDAESSHGSSNGGACQQQGGVAAVDPGAVAVMATQGESSQVTEAAAAADGTACKEHLLAAGEGRQADTVGVGEPSGHDRHTTLQRQGVQATGPQGAAGEAAGGVVGTAGAHRPQGPVGAQGLFGMHGSSVGVHSADSADHWQSWSNTCDIQTQRLNTLYDAELRHLFESEMHYDHWRKYACRDLVFESAWKLSLPAALASLLLSFSSSSSSASSPSPSSPSPSSSFPSSSSSSSSCSSQTDDGDQQSHITDPQSHLPHTTPQGEGVQPSTAHDTHRGNAHQSHTSPNTVRATTATHQQGQGHAPGQPTSGAPTTSSMPGSIAAAHEGGRAPGQQAASGVTSGVTRDAAAAPAPGGVMVSVRVWRPLWDAGDAEERLAEAQSTWDAVWGAMGIND